MKMITEKSNLLQQRLRFEFIIIIPYTITISTSNVMIFQLFIFIRDIINIKKILTMLIFNTILSTLTLDLVLSDYLVET